MKTIELLAVGIRLLGLYFAFQFLQFLSSAYFSYLQMASSMSEFNPLFIAYGYGLSAVVILILAIWFIKFPATVAGMLLSNSTKDSPTLSASAVDLQQAGMSFLGIYILSWAIPDLIQNVSLLAYFSSYDPSYGMGDRPYDVINMGVTVVEMAIGFYLTFQSAGLIALINKLRTAGT